MNQKSTQSSTNLNDDVTVIRSTSKGLVGVSVIAKQHVKLSRRTTDVCASVRSILPFTSSMCRFSHQLESSDESVRPEETFRHTKVICE